MVADSYPVSYPDPKPDPDHNGNRISIPIPMWTCVIMLFAVQLSWLSISWAIFGVSSLYQETYCRYISVFEVNWWPIGEGQMFWRGPSQNLCHLITFNRLGRWLCQWHQPTCLGQSYLLTKNTQNCIGIGLNFWIKLTAKTVDEDPSSYKRWISR